MLRTASIFGIVCLASMGVAGMFSDKERADIVSFWNEPGRYQTIAPAWAPQTGPYQVRLTVAGSTWLWNYNKVRGLGKVAPTAEPPVQNAEQAVWQKWIDAKIAYDRWFAGKNACDTNSRILGKSLLFEQPEPDHPGPAPEGLVKLAGNPPAFAESVSPLSYVIRFDDDTEIAYEDNVNMRPNYAYYRSELGVMSGGKKVRDLPKEEMENIFKQAGLSDSERKIMASVSLLEGGFDSVNTYDTGFVSVGLIQFACLKDGSGALGRMLRTYKQKNADGFDKDFRSYGVDVDSDGKLTVVDPATGAELAGSVAASKVIEDKRLIAVFQRAGLKSRNYRVAQILHAKQEFYPGDDTISVNLRGRDLNFKVSELIRSEAGLATLMDRKVNTGTIEPFTTMVVFVATENGLGSLSELKQFERDIIAAMKYRKDYLDDKTLSQPGPAKTPKRDYRAMMNRSGSRGGRKSGGKG